MIRRIGSGAPEKSLGLLVSGLKTATTNELRKTFLRGLREALKGRPRVAAPEGWPEAYTPLAQHDDAAIRLPALALAVTFGDAEAANKLRAIAADSKQPTSNDARHWHRWWARKTKMSRRS
jgi:hypothetical protein